MQETDISKFFRSPTCLLIAGSVFGLSAAIFFGQPLLAKQLDNWQLLPRPERVTELYFSGYRDVPVSANPGRARTIEFTVHNLEHQTTSYHYMLSVMPAEGRTEQIVDSGNFILDHDHFQRTSKRIMLPSLEGRIAIKVKLEYAGIAFGARVPSAQVQSIHYWTLAIRPDRGDHEGT